ncbi:MAG TPA: oxidoreductase [Anaeromyxobacter sp.]|nr:oxidoreductase [Anaeromyxobacter sp.]
MLGPTDYTPAPVIDAWDETPAFRGIRLALPQALAREHVRPGQVVKVHATGAGEAFFALASAPDPGATAELLVKRGGRVADAAIAAAARRGALEITRPFGNGFPIEDAEGCDLLLFAAGSAIAPIRALIQHAVVHRNRFGRVTLFYGQRHGAEFAYRAEHLDWERRGVRVVLCPSGADDAWQGVRGRVQEVARTLAFGGGPPGDAVAFVAGMTAMVDDVRATLAGAGIPPDRVHANF